MKKAVLIAGIVLLAAALVCFLISLFYNRMGGSVLDGSGDFYARMGRLRDGFGTAALWLCVAGAAALIVRLIMHFKK